MMPMTMSEADTIIERAVRPLGLMRVADAAGIAECP